MFCLCKSIVKSVFKAYVELSSDESELLFNYFFIYDTTRFIVNIYSTTSIPAVLFFKFNYIVGALNFWNKH